MFCAKWFVFLRLRSEQFESADRENLEKGYNDYFRDII